MGPGRREATRKIRRRAEREAKKARRVAAQRARNGTGGEAAGGPAPGRPGRPARQLHRRREGSPVPPEGGGRKRRRRERETLRRPTADERELSRLEKKLGMKKKKKSKTLPTAFTDDGLDYLLNLTERLVERGDDRLEDLVGSNVGTNEPGSSSEDEPVEAVTKSHRPRGGRTERMMSSTSKPRGGDSTSVVGLEKKKKLDRGVHRGGSDWEDGDTCDHGDEGEVGDDVEVWEGESDGCIDESEVSGQDGALSSAEDEEEEDERETQYVPPHMRERDVRRDSDQILQRTLQGLVNRLNESNIQPIATQLERMYTENSRNDMNSCLTEVLVRACVSPALISERFSMLHVMVVAILHNNVGSEVGAYLVQKLAQKLDTLLSEPPNYGRGKECNCVLLLIGHLYTFKVIHCVIIYDIIRKLVESFTERDVELLLLLLKNTGMEIRRDDATSLKDIILQIQSKAAASSALKESSRTRFMLETITALKTNNSRKIPNYDPSLVEHMRRVVRGLLHSSGPADENQLKISLADLLMADQQGKWWVVGSAWTGRESAAVPTGTSAVSVSAESWVLELARRQRMNTDVRRNIFCILMTSEDCVDAFEKLSRLGLKDRQEREIVHVLVECCLQEKQYNPYYAYLGQKFCEFSRTHQVTFQYSLWDRLKVLSEMTSFGRANLRQLLVHLVTSQALSLSILRVVEFTQLSRAEEVEFHRKLFHSLLVHCTEGTCKAVFSRVSVQPHLKSFRDSLLVFLKHHLSYSTALPPSSCSPSSLSRVPPGAEEKVLQTRLELVEHIMRTQQPIV